MKTREVDPYETLGVSHHASLHEIARAWRREAKRHHPDVTHDPQADERMSTINAAWEVLSDPGARMAWDSAHGIGRSRVAHATLSARWSTGDFHSPTTRYRPAARPVSSSGPAGWLVLAFVVLLLVAVLVAGLLSAASRPYDPSQLPPSVLHDNIRR
jgi:curved DNA-binding protein CbpA